GSVIYNFDDLRSLSFTVAEGYRAGGSYIRAAPGEPAEQREFDPEFLTNYEVAFRSFWPDYELTVNANVFYSDWEDQQVSVPGPTGTLLDVDVFNAGSSRLYGLELEINKPLSRTLNLTFTLGLLDTEFRDFPFAIDSNGDPINPDDPTYANLVGNAFNSAPETTAALTLAYNGSSGWFASGNVSYASDQFSDVTNLELNKVGDYTLVNGRVGYDWQYLTVSAFVNNLFDERFAGRQGISNVSNDTGTEQLNQQPFFVVNDPRLYGVEVRFSY
ncbi:MAG: outer membrane beta-barrel protein, partial [Pseudomonadota bacterium]